MKVCMPSCLRRGDSPLDSLGVHLPLCGSSRCTQREPIHLLPTPPLPPPKFLTRVSDLVSTPSSLCRLAAPRRHVRRLSRPNPSHHVRVRGGGLPPDGLPRGLAVL